MTTTITNTTIPIGKVLIEVDKKFNDEIILDGGKKLFLATEYNPEFHVTVTGKVHGLPKNMKGEEGKIVAELKLEDEVAFNFRVVMLKKYLPKPNTFLPIVDKETQKILTDSSKRKIMINAIPHKGGLHWVGVLLDFRGDWIDGCQGKQSDVERWYSQFKVGYDAPFVYKNLLEIDGKDYWLADPMDIYAKKTKGSVGIKSIGDRVIMKEILIDVSKRMAIQRGIYIPDGSILSAYNDRAKVISGGEFLGIRRGDEIFFEPKYIEKYNFFGNDYLIINRRRIHAIY